MTTQEYIENNIGITMQQARDFFFAFLLTHPKEVYDICLELGINNDMIAEIIAIEDITGQVVSDFFTSNEKDGDALGFNTNNTLDFTQDMLVGQTLYLVMVDKLYDYSEEGVAFTFSENSLTDGTDTASYEIVDGVVVLPEDGGNENHWILTEVTDTYYEFHGSVNSEISSDSYADRLYFNEADALAYYDSLLGVFEFSMDWLNGRTLYNVYSSNDNGDGDNTTLETVETFTFNDGIVMASEGWINNGDKSADYNVVGDGILYLGAPTDGTPSYVKAFETEDENVLGLFWCDSLECTSTVSQPHTDPDYFILDQTTATEFLDIA